MIDLSKWPTSEKFQVILADPPWSFETFSKKGIEKSAERHYDTMTFDELCSLPVPEVTAERAALFMYTTWPVLIDHKKLFYEVVDAWGFRPSGLAWEWIKFNKATGKFAFGGGYGTRKNVEPCVLCIKKKGKSGIAKPKLKSRSVRDMIFAQRREHSRKPDEHYAIIEQMFDGPYLELFGRTPVEGWSRWGNDTERFPLLTRLPT